MNDVLYTVYLLNISELLPEILTWNIHHILPKTCGGTNAISNLICTNIATNDEAADKITFWIDDCLYQVKKTEDGHDIFQIK